LSKGLTLVPNVDHTRMLTWLRMSCEHLLYRRFEIVPPARSQITDPGGRVEQDAAGHLWLLDAGLAPVPQLLEVHLDEP
jgi:hypothetical protein